MSLRDQFMQNPSLEFENNIFYQKGPIRSSEFEQAYVALRKKEGRVYADDVVNNLPEIPDTHALKHEWLVRRISLNKLSAYLERRSSCKKILEIGCGNGWLSHNLSRKLGVGVCAMDINHAELQQGARVFSKNTKICFTCADIFTLPDAFVLFDTIILASSIQYFPDLKKLIDRLLKLLTADGEIHIIDSPLYSSADAVRAAQKRTEDYFNSLGFPGMINKYFHHTMVEISGFNHKVLFNPESFLSRALRKILKQPQPVFHWIVLKKVAGYQPG